MVRKASIAARPSLTVDTAKPRIANRISRTRRVLGSSSATRILIGAFAMFATTDLVQVCNPAEADGQTYLPGNPHKGA